MAFTDNCDLYVAIHEDGINQIIKHIMMQRPSLFNYATESIADKSEMWCSPVNYTNDVKNFNNSIFTKVGPIPIFGSDSPPVSLNFCAQLLKAKIDFHPENVISIPGELNPPLEEQHFCLEFEICAGINCPSDKDMSGLPNPNPDPSKPPPSPIVLGGSKPTCFCLDVFIIGHFEHKEIQGKKVLRGMVDGIDIVDIKPESLEENLICLMKTAVNVMFQQKFFIPLDAISLGFSNDFTSLNLSVFPTPLNKVPNNPSIDDNQLKAFVSIG